MKRVRRVIPFVAVAAMVLAGSDAGAVVDLCSRAKILAAAKAGKTYLICKAKSATEDDLVACKSKAQNKLSAAFLKADATSACRGTIAGCTFVAEQAVDTVTPLLSGDAKCDKAWLKTGAKLAMSWAKCMSDYYKGKRTSGEVDDCRSAALLKFNKVASKTAAKYSTCTVDGDLIRDAAIGYGQGVTPVASDTARICERCCQVSKVTEPDAGPVGCAAASTEIVTTGCEDAAQQYASVDFAGALADPDLNVCDGGAGACVAATATPSTEPAFCCQFTVNVDGQDRTACAQGPATQAGYDGCTIAGTWEGYQAPCEATGDGAMSCAPVAP